MRKELSTSPPENSATTNTAVLEVLISNATGLATSVPELSNFARRVLCNVSGTLLTPKPRPSRRFQTACAPADASESIFNNNRRLRGCARAGSRLVVRHSRQCRNPQSVRRTRDGGKYQAHNLCERMD